ncbi:MAG: hypothetical protein PHF11_02220 [Candidatus Omnitrophica bacterium]|nr:hypothetical protein [Candidatus Omnitrophota bacterium]
MNKDREIKYAIIIFLFLFNLIIGMSFINEGLFHFDSVILAQATENTYKTGILQPALKGRYGSVIINSIVYLPFFLLGQTADFATRFSSLLFHSLSVVALFLFIRELFNDSFQAFCASLLLSLTPFYLSPNTYGKEHGASIFFLIFSFYLLYRGMGKKSYILVGLSSCLFAFSITIRESMLTGIPLFFLLYLKPDISVRPFRIVFSKERINFKSLLWVILPFSFIFLLAFFPYLKYEIYRALYIKDNVSAYFLGLFSPVFKLALRDINLSITPFIFVLFFIGLFRMALDKKLFFTLFFLLWFMLLFYFGNLSSYEARYLDMVAIPVYVFVSYALSRLYRRYRILTPAILICFVLYMFVRAYPLLEFRHRFNGEKQFALYIKGKTEDNAVIIAMDDAPFIEYYGGRKVIGCPIGDAGATEGFIKTVKGLLKDKKPVYLIESGLQYDFSGVVKKSIIDNFAINYAGEGLAEDYHKCNLGFNTYCHKFFKLGLKNN